MAKSRGATGAWSINADDFLDFAEKTKGLPRKVKTRVRRRIRDAASEFGEEITAEGAEAMPGAAPAHIKSKQWKPAITQNNTGVRMAFGRSRGPRVGTMNAGNLRHPVFGRRKSATGVSWVDQRVEAGSWTEAAEKRLPEIRDAVAEEMTKIMKELG